MSVVRDRRVWIAAGAGALLVLAAAVAFGSSTVQTPRSPALPKVITPRPLHPVVTVAPPTQAAIATRTAPASAVATPVPTQPKLQAKPKTSGPAPVTEPAAPKARPEPKAQPKPEPKVTPPAAPPREVVSPYVREEDEQSFDREPEPEESEAEAQSIGSVRDEGDRSRDAGDEAFSEAVRAGVTQRIGETRERGAHARRGRPNEGTRRSARHTAREGRS